MGERGDVGTTITNLIAAMPKVELHVHLEGCVTPEMALHFARKNRWSYPYESIVQALAAMEFSDLSSFIEVARVNNRTLRTVDDYCDVAKQYLKRMHDENVVHVEVAVSPQGFTRRGLEVKPLHGGPGERVPRSPRQFRNDGRHYRGVPARSPAGRGAGDAERAESLQGRHPCRRLARSRMAKRAEAVRAAFSICPRSGMAHRRSRGRGGTGGLRRSGNRHTCGRKDRSRRSRGGRSRAVRSPCCPPDSSYCVPALERQSRRLRTAGRTQHRATAAPWHCGLATFRRSALFRRLSLPLLRTDRCRARSLSRGSGRNEQECYPSRVPGRQEETKTSGGFGRSLERDRLGGV